MSSSTGELIWIATDLAEILRYIEAGVRNSEDIEAHSGTRLGG